MPGSFDRPATDAKALGSGFFYCALRAGVRTGLEQEARHRNREAERQVGPIAWPLLVNVRQARRWFERRGYDREERDDRANLRAELPRLGCLMPPRTTFESSKCVAPDRRIRRPTAVSEPYLYEPVDCSKGTKA